MLYRILDQAATPDSLVTQVSAVLGVLRGMGAADLAVWRFKADYALMWLWGRRRDGPKFEAALQRLVNPPQGVPSRRC
jgi:hypothetical protein